jgi:hypothetical protein
MATEAAVRSPVIVEVEPSFKSASSLPTVSVDRAVRPTAQHGSEIITEMHEDGTLRQLSEKWYGIDLSAPDVQESGDE